METYFTGQKINPENQDEVTCPECGEYVNVRKNAWFDAFSKHTSTGHKHGVYVHFGCLSETRLAQIREVQHGQ